MKSPLSLISAGALALALTLAPSALAQSFNVDIGMNLAFFAGIPSDTYGAAAGQPGTWNAFLPSFTAAPLVDLLGQSSTVTLRSDATSTFNVFPGVMTPGDDQRLMEDFHITPNLNQNSTWTFEGLDDGEYDVYTYASDPSLSGLQTVIEVTQSLDPPQQIGAGWPGAHALGQTYSLHRVTVIGGTLELQAGTPGGMLDSGVLNGIQIIGPGGGFTLNYCMANANSTGLAASMGATGSPFVASNDVTLTASRMPQFSFGFFLTSRMRGFVQNPAGSAGNLCLSGAIGRFVGPGQIQNTGTAGAMSLALDLTSLPTPTGFVAAQAGETWDFTAWFRDVSAAGPTSNFADGYEIVFQ
ncbi:hypothetical protein Poly30_42230 [Planctomycetes bacterium Poly30]|uniref:Uncharacterized protein n=1 Tax=Saltatorellus ferox TaxID=2528018 RepID=A0A518EX61_9BACT|nr:hypothetical protein Poly30_42230 [Planctomycetes bacterium Poly30]